MGEDTPEVYVPRGLRRNLGTTIARVMLRFHDRTGSTPDAAARGGKEFLTTTRRWLVGMALALGLATVASQDVTAQVVEGRDAESNPASVIFRSTVYGAGTGVVLAGAYTLISEDDDAWDSFRWGAGIGAVAGLVTGLIHVATRSQPEDDGVGGGMVLMHRDGIRFSTRSVVQPGVRQLPRGASKPFDLHLLTVRF